MGFYVGGFSIDDSPAYDQVEYWAGFFPTDAASLAGTGGSVAIQVLDKFDIPYEESGRTGGSLPGMDIKGMQASQAFNLSLAEELKDSVFLEAHMDGDGVVRFSEVGGDPGTINTWFSFSTDSLKTPLDTVIISGYDPPILRWRGNGLDYLKNKSIYGIPDDVMNSICGGSILYKIAYIVFEDGIESSSYGSIIGGVEIGRYDNHIGFIYIINNPGGVDVSWSISNSTREFIDITSNMPTAFINYTGDPTGDNPGCWYNATPVGCSNTIKLGPFIKYDPNREENVPDFQQIARIFFIGREVISVSSFGGEGGSLAARHEKKVANIPPEDFTIEEDLATGEIQICFKRVRSVNETVLYNLADQALEQISFYDQAGNLVETIPGGTGYTWVVDFAGRRMGWLIEKMYVEVIRNRPCITVNDEAGDALTHAGNLTITAMPVFTTDNPAPIALASTDPLADSIELDTDGLVDQEAGMIDNNPTTLQEYTDTTDFKLEALRQGSVVEISLPFLENNQLQTMADQLLGLYNEDAQVTTYMCSPTSDPNLGGLYNDRIINSIEYSYQDSSSYQITVVTGPRMEKNMGFASSLFQMETETVSTEGVITQVGGNGYNYTVKTNKFGSLPAYSGIKEDMEVGDRVQVTIHNYPKVSFGGKY